MQSIKGKAKDRCNATDVREKNIQSDFALRPRAVRPPSSAEIARAKVTTPASAHQKEEANPKVEKAKMAGEKALVKAVGKENVGLRARDSTKVGLAKAERERACMH
jgi:hypothetical protein